MKIFGKTLCLSRRKWRADESQGRAQPAREK